jgi:hypothetical protein
MKRIAYLIVWAVLFTLTAFQCENGKDCCALPPCSEIGSLAGTWRLDYFENTATGRVDADPEISGEERRFQLFG